MTETLIRYGNDSPFWRWSKKFFTQDESRTAVWVLCGTLLVFIVSGPHLILMLVSLLPVSQLGNSGASQSAHQAILWIASVLATAVAAYTISRICQPKWIAVSEEGLRKVWQLGPFRLGGQGTLWKHVQTISLQKAPGATDTRGYLLKMVSKSGRLLTIRAGKIADGPDRQVLFDAIATKVRDGEVEPAVFDILKPAGTLRFTELWLDALSAPPQRERLLPLSAGMVMDARYRIVSRLGAGGQGTVYLADDTTGGAKVVLKETILPVYGDLVARKRAIEDFHKEAMALERLNHQRIVKFLRSFVSDHRAYLVLEFIRGTTLSDYVKAAGALPAKQAIAFGVQMCEILTALHTADPSIIHRDFTPDNLILKDECDLTLIDFAVAINGSDGSSEVAGKISYMSPEQLKGEPGCATDIYALGCCLYFMLTGEHPEPLGEAMPILANSNVPMDLNEVVLKCTKTDSAARFQTSLDVKQALENAAC